MVVRSVAVLGAGTMGAQIAAHFANAGVPALLLDITADAVERAYREGAGFGRHHLDGLFEKLGDLRSESDRAGQGNEPGFG